MRNDALFWMLVILFTVFLTVPLTAEGQLLVGKQPVWEVWGEASKPSTVSTTTGESLETPNHRRLRLGIHAEDSAPTPEYGVHQETPNQRRNRLKLASTGIPGAIPEQPSKSQ